MSYEFGKMRPPTPVEMAARRVPLEITVVEWTTADDVADQDKYLTWLDEQGLLTEYDKRRNTAYVGSGTARDCPAEPSIPELLAYIRSSNIPYDAKIVYHECGSHQLALDWTHLELCAVCLAWREPHGEDDKLHFAMAEAARLTAEHGVPA